MIRLSSPHVRTGVSGSPFLGYGDEFECSDGVIILLYMWEAGEMMGRMMCCMYNVFSEKPGLALQSEGIGSSLFYCLCRKTILYICCGCWCRRSRKRIVPAPFEKEQCPWGKAFKARCSAQGHRVVQFPGRIVGKNRKSRKKRRNCKSVARITDSLEEEFTIYNQTSGSIHTDIQEVENSGALPESQTTY